MKECPKNLPPGSIVVIESPTRVDISTMLSTGEAIVILDGRRLPLMKFKALTSFSVFNVALSLSEFEHAFERHCR